MDYKSQISSSKRESSIPKFVKRIEKTKSKNETKTAVQNESMKINNLSDGDKKLNKNLEEANFNNINTNRRLSSIIESASIFKDSNKHSMSQFFHRDKNIPISSQQALIKKNENSNYMSLISNQSHVVSYSALSIPGESLLQGSKQNQDEHLELPNFLGVAGNFLFSVMDGHGYQGHYVSKMLRERLPIIIKSECGEKIKVASLNSVFNQANLELTKSQIDCSLSGSTCIVILLLQNHLISANVGDSRAVLGSFINNTWKCTPLSFDHKPSDPNEIARIIEKGGRVEPYITENGVKSGPPRVWLGTSLIPGLAMSRSMGDSVAASVGVISKPDIIEHHIEPEDKIIILASDGVWEFITNDESIEIVSPYYLSRDTKGACNALIKESAFRWLKREGISDDITCIIIFLKS